MNDVRKANKALKDHGLEKFMIRAAKDRGNTYYRLYAVNGTSKQSLGYAPRVGVLFDELYMRFQGNPAVQQRIEAASQQYYA